MAMSARHYLDSLIEMGRPNLKIAAAFLGFESWSAQKEETSGAPALITLCFLMTDEMSPSATIASFPHERLNLETESQNKPFFP